MNYKINKHRYFIIGGTSKAGTTSLFNYLAGHPQICAAEGKETRFFLDDKYPLSSKLRHTSGIEKYEGFFKCKNEKQIRLDVTPDYLHSSNTALLIRDSVANVKIAFVLRDPIERLKSWYRFGIQMGHLNGKVTFDDFVKEQIKNEKESSSVAVSHPTFLSLSQGRYSLVLNEYYRVFPKEDVLVCFYEDLSSDPRAFTKRVCTFIGIESTYYDNYDFKTINRTVETRSPVVHRTQYRIRALLQQYKQNKPRLQAWLARISSRLEPLYRSVNIMTPEKVQIDEKTMAKLQEYYRAEMSYFRDRLGVNPPWKL